MVCIVLCLVGVDCIFGCAFGVGPMGLVWGMGCVWLWVLLVLAGYVDCGFWVAFSVAC